MSGAPLPSELEPPFWPASLVEDLGTVTAPAGELVLIGFGLLRYWSGEAESVLDPGLVGESVAVAANKAVDMRSLTWW